jgi:opacity protein-like surface antigen
MKRVIALTISVLGLATPSLAQDWKGFISANGGYQTTAREFEDNVTFTAFAEQGDFDVRYKAPAGPLFDFSGAYRIWKNLAIGAGLSAYRKQAPAVVEARLPYPFDFNLHREASGDVGSLRREELAVHVQAMWMIPVSNSIDVAVFGGPSYFRVQQPFVQTLEYIYSYPFDTATVTGANTTPQKQTAPGFNAGVDVTYMLTKSVGVGAVLRYSEANVEFTSADNQTFKAKVGGPQVGAGIRFRF